MFCRSPMYEDWLIVICVENGRIWHFVNNTRPITVKLEVLKISWHFTLFTLTASAFKLLPFKVTQSHITPLSLCVLTKRTNNLVFPPLATESTTLPEGTAISFQLSNHSAQRQTHPLTTSICFLSNRHHLHPQKLTEHPR